MMANAIYPGSFDPITYGHIDIIRRASKAVDRLVIGVLNNTSKTPLFSSEERVEFIREAVKDIPNVAVEAFSGLSVDFAKAMDASIIVRGLRAVTDFEYELQLSQTNRKIAPEIDTVFYTTSLQYAYLSSSIVKEVALFDGDISEFVPEFLVSKIKDKIHQKK
ncbi:MAG: pantetheine-phosphate adenylyltransferase [Lachnospiraceae bacterium]|nr:pantetheine-phosphate adenylyltransferase [Lachnospiraceae bacterium]